MLHSKLVEVCRKCRTDKQTSKNMFVDYVQLATNSFWIITIPCMYFIIFYIATLMAKYFVFCRRNKIIKHKKLHISNKSTLSDSDSHSHSHSTNKKKKTKKPCFIYQNITFMLVLHDYWLRLYWQTNFLCFV